MFRRFSNPGELHMGYFFEITFAHPDETNLMYSVGPPFLYFAPQHPPTFSNTPLKVLFLQLDAKLGFVPV